jgi:hypothetical protein
VTALTWTTDSRTRITSCRLTADQLGAARVLGGPREAGGIVEVDLNGAAAWGSLGGQVVNLRGLRLGPIVWPTYEDAKRAKAWATVSGPDHEADANEIDAILAARALHYEAV